MKRKLISLVCTFAMLMTILSSFCVASADAAVSMNIALDEANSTDTTKVLNVSYSGLTSIASLQFELPIDVEKVSKITLDWDSSLASAIKNANVDGNGALTGEYTDKIVALAFSFASEVTVPNGEFLTITLELNEALTEDMVLQLGGLVLQGDGAATPVEDIAAGSVTVKAPAATDAPVVTTAPIVVDKGMNLTLDEENSTETTKVVKVSYVGFTSIASLQFELPIDVEKVSKITLDWDSSLASAIKNANVDANGALTGEYTDKIVALAFSFASEVTVPNGEFLTITLELNEALTEEMVLQLGGLVLQGDGASTPAEDIAGGNLVLQPIPVETDVPATDVPATDVPATDVPATATPIPADPRPTVMPTAEPGATAEPTATPVVTTAPIVVDKGMNLTLDEENSTETTKVVKVSYVGFTSIASLQFELPIDVEKVSKITLDWDSSLASAIKNANVDANGALTGEYTDKIVALAFSFASEVTVPNGEFLTITLELNEALTEEMVLQLGGLVLQGDGASTPAEDIAGGNLVLQPTPAETPTPEETPAPTEAPEVSSTVAMKDMLDSTKATGENTYVTVTTKGVYGTDYVVKDADGNVLSEADFFNTIWGYNEAVSAADAINGYTFVIYNDDVEIEVALNVDGVKVDTGSNVEEPQPTEKPSNNKKSISWESSSVSIKKGKTKTVELELNNIDKDDVKNVTYKVTSGTAIVDVDRKSDYKVEVEGLKAGTAKVKATVTTKDGEEYTDTLTVKVTTTSSNSGSGNGGSGSSNSISSIAGTNGTTGNGNVSNVSVNFTDLGDAAWASTAINFLASIGVVNGRTATTFEPNAYVTRAEFTKLVLAAIGMTVPADAYTTSSYTDVAADAWYLGYVEAASMLGIVTGYPEGDFRPDALVSRQEMAAIVNRAVAVRNASLPTVQAATAWADADQIGDWAVEAVTALNVAGVINGTSATTFEPTAAATRAQAAQIIYNLYQAIN